MAMALLAVVSTGATADEPQGQGYGLGMKSCAEFAKEYRAQPALTESLFFAWAEGFMSGLNLVATANSLPARRLASIDMGSAEIQIRGYCDAHPLSQYVGAVVTIYNSLPGLPENSN